MPLRRHATALDVLYARYNRRRFVHPDPLEFLYHYPDPDDREVVALVASSLAYGRVVQIVRSVRTALERMGPRPGRFVRDGSPGRLRARFAGFRHRVTAGDDLAAMLHGAGRAIRRHGSLRRCFTRITSRRDETVLPALGQFVGELRAGAGRPCAHLLADPGKGSACKRLHLMLRWLVRQDAVDPGGWGGVPAAGLIVPLDTHMHKIARSLGATGRKQADIKTAVEVTAAFRRVCPHDPVRYDFALTRLGIRREGRLKDVLAGI